jgi:hypothetical protein
VSELTRAVARRGGGGELQAAAFKAGGTAPVTGGDGGVALQYRGGRGKVRHTAIGSHDAWRNDSSRRQKPMSVVAQTPGDKAVRRSEDGADRLGGEMRGGGTWSGWRRMERKGERGRRPAPFEGARLRGAVIEKGGALRARARGAERRRRGGGGLARRRAAPRWLSEAAARARWRRVAEQGRRQGAGDTTWVRLTSGAGRVEGPVSAAGCGREREERGSATVGHRHVGPGSTVAGGTI